LALGGQPASISRRELPTCAKGLRDCTDWCGIDYSASRSAATFFYSATRDTIGGVSLCATVRGHVNLGYPLIQYRYVQVLPAIQNISASFDPIDAIGTAQAGFRRKRGYFPGKKRSFGFLDFITDPESRETRTSLRLRSSKVDML
jgi:hypothetical protein